MSRLNIGAECTEPPVGKDIRMERNRSISRVIPVPGDLAPGNDNCELLAPTVSA